MSGPGVVIGLLGPTAAGKSDIAVEVAWLVDTRIISCDSMQVYRGFPVLTNQPSPSQLAAVRHELVGCAEPFEAFSAAEYGAAARALIEEDLEHSGWALLAGGTGLYMRAALAPLQVAPENQELRVELESRAQRESPMVLHAELARQDPEAAAQIDVRNVRRVIRALEAVSVTGKAWSGRADLWAPVYDHPTLIVGITVERTELYRRIDMRAARMVHRGATEEVARFRAEYGAERTRAGGPGIRSAIGYGDICLYLEGRRMIEQTVSEIASATRGYARRQLTWLRKVEGAVIIDVQHRDPREVAREIVALASDVKREQGV